MKTADKIKNAVTLAGETMASVVNIALNSRRFGSLDKTEDNKEIVLLGNGPSLRDTIDNHSSWLASRDKLAVNFAANADEFFTLKPDSYVVADPLFFVGASSDPNVIRLWKAFSEVSWPMTLFVPFPYLSSARSLLKSDVVKLRGYNLVPVEGFSFIRNFAFARGLGMPRPRNVLIPSIMLAIWQGYGKIYLAGADHTWSKTLWVDDENRVMTRLPHFYKDNDEERARLDTTYSRIHIHEVYRSLSIAFGSYFKIKEFADRNHVGIFNITPGSFIDAFPRLALGIYSK